ncbi:DEAD/DEAH box helicase [Shouchella sp. JSM 1781072]|uniref:DEAD/DEAH box helicase n=1 Tax=Shouchella sp. JSM 1781072 TaxID=3344581 RepID=UPI0035C24313
MTSDDVQKIRLFLYDRCMLSSEWPFSNELLIQAIEKEVIQSEPTLVQENGQWTCKRCGNEKQTLFYAHYCYHCQSLCTYCRHCIEMGKASSCTQLLTCSATQLRYKPQENSCRWEGVLSFHQEQASIQLIKAVEQQNQTHLVWAVCGAGKTEILFPMIEKSLQLGMRIGIATPRTDVVKELSPRLKEAFPSIKQSSLYAGSRQKNPLAQLVIATTHQLLRYHHAFDVLIIDEVDAFPYTYDRSLHYASSRAKKPHATTIFLSATPSKRMLNTPSITVTKIPVRFHGKPIPQPRFQWIGNWQRRFNKGSLPPIVHQWLMKHDDKPLLLFFPSIEMLKKCSSILHSLRIKHEFVYAGATERHKHVQAFREGKTNLLLTTTILERGVTVENLQVAVIGAEQPIFDEACLVQIAGRVGRKQAFPDGDVVYWHYGVTHSMMKAKRHIRQMNNEGKK